MKISNASQLPTRFFGLHFCPGTAEYVEPGKEPYKVYINGDTAKQMDPTFEGKPVYVGHRDEVNLKDLATEIDGLVVRSFYNALDGKQWVEFMVMSDAGHEAIKKGWRLSNSYVPDTLGSGGQWNGMQYKNEIVKATYHHLAIVPNPRYAESVILTPEEFKAYNDNKASEIKRLSNSQEKQSMFNLFKREPVKNAADFDGMMIALPKSGREITINQLVEEADKAAALKGFASGEEKFKVGESEMTVNAMAKELCNMKKANEDREEEDKKKEKEAKDNADMSEEDKKKKAAEMEEKENAKKKNELLELAKKNGMEHFLQLQNADKVEQVTQNVIQDGVALGKANYGSDN